MNYKYKNEEGNTISEKSGSLEDSIYSILNCFEKNNQKICLIDVFFENYKNFKLELEYISQNDLNSRISTEAIWLCFNVSFGIENNNSFSSIQNAIKIKEDEIYSFLGAGALCKTENQIVSNTITINFIYELVEAPHHFSIQMKDILAQFLALNKFISENI